MGKKPDVYAEIKATLERQKNTLDEINKRLKLAEETVKALRMALEDSQK